LLFNQVHFDRRMLFDIRISASTLQTPTKDVLRHISPRLHTATHVPFLAV